MKARPRHFCGVPGCGKSFDRPAKLVDHQRLHSGERPFTCAACGQTFAQKKHLHVHEIHHLGHNERPFQCKTCGKGYVSRQQYDRHVQTHDPPQKYHCEHCSLAFIQKKSYLSHISRHRSCEICHKMCKNERDLALHQIKRHSKRFHCSFCAERFETAEGLRSHCGKVHSHLSGKHDPVPETTASIVGLNYEQRQFGCPLDCGKRFTRHYDVQRHLSKEHNLVNENFLRRSYKSV